MRCLGQDGNTGTLYLVLLFFLRMWITLRPRIFTNSAALLFYCEVLGFTAGLLSPRTADLEILPLRSKLKDVSFKRG